MEVLFPTIFLVLLGFVLLLNVITLPANWIMLGLTCHAIFQVPVYPEVTTF